MGLIGPLLPCFLARHLVVHLGSFHYNLPKLLCALYLWQGNINAIKWKCNLLHCQHNWHFGTFFLQFRFLALLSKQWVTEGGKTFSGQYLFDLHWLIHYKWLTSIVSMITQDKNPEIVRQINGNILLRFFSSSYSQNNNVLHTNYRMKNIRLVIEWNIHGWFIVHGGFFPSFPSTFSPQLYIKELP